jgi:hypothetical protein
MFENKVLRRIFGTEREDITGRYRKVHNEELHRVSQEERSVFWEIIVSVILRKKVI